MKRILIAIINCTILTIAVSQTTQEISIGNTINLNFDNSNKKASSEENCDTIYSFSVPDFWPSGLACNGNNIWVSGYNKPFIFKMDTFGNVIDSIPSPSRNQYHGGSLDYDGKNLLCVVEEDGILYKINPNTGSVVQQFKLPKPGVSHNNLGTAYDGKNIWNVSHHPNVLYKLDPNDGQILDSMHLTSSIVVLVWIKGNLYGLNSFFEPTDYLYKISTINGTYIDSMKWCVNIVSDLSWDSKNLWCLNTLGSSKRIYKMGNCFTFITSVTDEVNHSNNKKVLIYPNPTTNKINIKAEKIIEIKLTDLTGRSIPILQNLNQIDLMNEPNGLYLVMVKTKDGFIVEKVIKQ